MTRLLSGVVLAAAALAAILFLPFQALRLAACVVAVLAAGEYLRIAAASGLASASTPAREIPASIPGNVPTLALVAVTCWLTPAPGAVALPVLLLAALAWLAAAVLWRAASIQDAATAFVAPWYIGLPLGMLVAVHAAGGAGATLLLLATVVVSDSAQYYTGRTFGRRPLAPAISPKKTIEGAIGGVVFGTLFMAVAGARVLGAPPLPLAVLGLAIVVLGICGDLFESRLKRTAGVKDSSALIPGHGGILDRIDALLFAAPAFYLYMHPPLWWQGMLQGVSK